MKRTASICALATLLALCLCVFCSCSNKKTPPPDFNEIRDELIERIENSKEINEILWGKGLPVIPIGSERADDIGLYNPYDTNTTDDYGVWEFVDPTKTAYISIDSIKALAEGVYSKAFLAPIYQAHFVGLYNNVEGHALNPHYYEDNYGFWQNANSENEFRLFDKTRIYKYETMKMDEAKSSGERVFVTVDTYLEGESTILTVDLVFDKQENGWYLSTPTC